MVELHANERLIIDQLLDRGLFTSTITAEMPQNVATAVTAFQRPLVQRRVTSYLKELLGVAPYNYQENLLWLAGPGQLSADEVHVLLATLKTVLNEPSLQANADERVVATQTIVRQVRSEVVNLDEKLILRLIRQLFVERFKLLTPERLEQAASDQEAIIDEYWSVSPDFASFARNLVDYLQAQVKKPALTELQQVNQALLLQPFLSPQTTPTLWPILVAKRQVIAAQWAQLQRFELEVGADYALLLDRQRQQITARPYTVALAVARSLGAGLPEDQLNQRIHQVVAQLFGSPQKVAVGQVRAALFDNGLVLQAGQNVLPTAIAQRFSVQATTEEK